MAKKLAIEVREVENGFVVYPAASPMQGFAQGPQHVATSIPELCKLVEKFAKDARAKQAE